MTQELRDEILVSRSCRDEALKRISEEKEKFASIDIEDLKASECNPKFPLTIVDSIHARFQDSIESIKQKVKNFLASSQGDVSLCLFDLAKIIFLLLLKIFFISSLLSNSS